MNKQRARSLARVSCTACFLPSFLTNTGAPGRYRKGGGGVSPYLARSVPSTSPSSSSFADCSSTTMWKSGSESDPEEPLSRRASSRTNCFEGGAGPLAAPSLATKSTFGMMGSSMGAAVSVVMFALDVATDAFLVFGVASLALNEPNYYRRKEEEQWFIATAVTVFLPLLITNTLSLFWYIGNEASLGTDERIFQTKSTSRKCLCVFLHIGLLGSISRYLDALHHCSLIGKHSKLVDWRWRGTAAPGTFRGTLAGSRGSLRRAATSEDISFRKLEVLSRDTATLDLINSFFKNVPNIALQTFCIYRMDSRLLQDDSHVLAVTSQVTKIVSGLLVTSWHLTSFQDQLRRSFPDRRQMTRGAVIVCLVWRVAELASRLLSLASFSALKVNSEGGLVKTYSNDAPGGLLVSFPLIALLVVLGHWFLIVIWIHAQKANFCATAGAPRSCLEFLNTILMSWVCVFGYLNLRETPSRGRMAFFYALVFSENTALMVVWYLQLITKEVWLRVTVVFVAEALFLIGISCALGYFAFLHPGREPPPLTRRISEISLHR